MYTHNISQTELVPVHCLLHSPALVLQFEQKLDYQIHLIQLSGTRFGIDCDENINIFCPDAYAQ